jgi:hypothetical protein
VFGPLIPLPVLSASNINAASAPLTGGVIVFEENLELFSFGEGVVLDCFDAMVA